MIDAALYPDGYLILNIITGNGGNASKKPIETALKEKLMDDKFELYWVSNLLGESAPELIEQLIAFRQSIKTDSAELKEIYPPGEEYKECDRLAKNIGYAIVEHFELQGRQQIKPVRRVFRKGKVYQ